MKAITSPNIPKKQHKARKHIVPYSKSEYCLFCTFLVLDGLRGGSGGSNSSSSSPSGTICSTTMGEKIYGSAARSPAQVFISSDVCHR